MKNILFVILIAFIATSCCTEKRCAKRYPPKIIDSVFTSTDTTNHTRDTTVYTPEYISLYRALIDCDSNHMATIKYYESIDNGKLVLEITQPDLKNNTIYLKCKVDSQAVALKWNEKHITKNKVEIKYFPSETNIITGWQWFQIYCGRILWVLIIILSVYLFIKYKFKKPRL